MTHLMARGGFPGRRAAPRDGCPSGKRRNAPGKPPRATAGRSLFVAGCVAGRLTWGHTTARPAPIQRRKSIGQMGHYYPPLVLVRVERSSRAIGDNAPNPKTVTSAARCGLKLCRPGLRPRDGLPAESVLRCALLKQYRQLSYQELAFHLSDSASFRAFARLPLRARRSVPPGELIRCCAWIDGLSGGKVSTSHDKSNF